MIELSFNNVKVHFMGDETFLSVDRFIPEEESASFITEDLELYENYSSPKMIKFKMSYWDKKALKQFHISPMQIMHGKNTYYGKLRLSGVSINNYAIKPPSLKVGNQIFEIPVIKFTKKRDSVLGQ